MALAPRDLKNITKVPIAKKKKKNCLSSQLLLPRFYQDVVDVLLLDSVFTCGSVWGSNGENS
jgi:hypothetical protein